MDIYQEYKTDLLSSIPVVSGMDIDISKIETNSISLTAPLNTNINYEGTAFGGSLNTLCILSSYLLVHHILKQSNSNFSSLVIQDSSIQYFKPVDKDFCAKSSVLPKDKTILLKLVEKKGIGRISVKSEIIDPSTGETKVQFQGRFVASK